MLRSLVGSEMCIRDRIYTATNVQSLWGLYQEEKVSYHIDVIGYDEDTICLLYTSDAADDLLCVDLGGRRVIKKKNNDDIVENYEHVRI